jgi:hypothetical protein
MSLRVYHADVNPAVESFSYRLSENRGKDLVSSGQGQFIELPDGRLAVQLFRRRADREQWIERLAEAADGRSPMPFLKFIPPQDEQWKQIQAESKIVNVRRLQSIPA